MKIYLVATDSEYEMNNPYAREALRDDLKKAGFFNYPENKNLWTLIERPKAEGKEVESFLQAIKIFNSVLSGLNRKAD